MFIKHRFYSRGLKEWVSIFWAEPSGWKVYLSNLPVNYTTQAFSRLSYMFPLANKHYIMPYVINNATFYQSKEYSFERHSINKITVWISEDRELISGGAGSAYVV